MLMRAIRSLMNYRPRVLVDVDGILADFVSVYLGTATLVTGRKYTRDQVTTWKIEQALGLTEAETDEVTRGITRAGSVAAFPEIPGAIEAVRELQEWADVYFVTSPWPGAPHWVSEREAWLRARFPNMGRNVIHTAVKEVVSGDVLVDDNLDHVLKWAERHPQGTGILWETPYNRDAVMVGNTIKVNKWSHIFWELGLNVE